MSRVLIPPKPVGSTYNQSFDYTSQLAVGETISTQVVTATVWQGTDATPSTIISGSASASGAIVTQSITGGTLGVIYKLLCTITTSTGQTLLLVGYLAVIPDVV